MPNLRSEFKTDRFDQLPASRTCTRCGETKPRVEMIVQHRREKNGASYYYFRPLCKACNNARERGHRIEYKKRYRNQWRRQNAALTRSYWDNPVSREAARVRAANFSREQKDAIAIQRRQRSRGELLTIEECRELLAKYGRCYPTRFGLTAKGKAECERIRSRLRAKAKKTGRRVLSIYEIRLMVYEQSEDEPGLIIPPDEQPQPYQASAERMRKLRRKDRQLTA